MVNHYIDVNMGFHESPERAAVRSKCHDLPDRHRSHRGFQ